MNIVVPMNGKIMLGRQGENLATKVIIPLKEVKSGEGYAVLVNQRPKDPAPYPVAIEEDEYGVSWEVTSADTEYYGTGHAELRWMGPNGEIIKSRVYSTFVQQGLSEPAEAPSVWQGYITQIEKMCADKITEPEAEGKAGQVLATDGNGGRYWTTVQGGTASGGDLPSVAEEDNGKILQVEGGQWVAKSLPTYDGTIEVIPSAEDQVMQTANTYMTENVTVAAVPYTEVTNTADGITAIIL